MSASKGLLSSGEDYMYSGFNMLIIANGYDGYDHEKCIVAYFTN